MSMLSVYHVASHPGLSGEALRTAANDAHAATRPWDVVAGPLAGEDVAAWVAANTPQPEGE